MIDNWTPAQDDIDWTRNHFDSMAVGDTWSVSGALLEKTDASELTLRQYPPESSMAIERVAAVCNQIDVKFESEGSELIEDPMDAAQKAAQEWVDPASDIPLINFGLENATWFVNAVPSQDEQGESVIIDQWSVRITHPNEDGDEHEVLMTPMDYHIIAGDDLFFAWKGMRVIEREEAIELADNREKLMDGLADSTIELLGTMHNDTAVPPHLRGMFMAHTNLDEEE
tara:strand:- start:313 stop:993 length:681 start_codon:yes stop_codon:yes gene_type:complete